MKHYWQEETLYTEANTFFQALLHDISKANRSVALETYIFNKDHIGERVIKTLRQAAERGVNIRVLMDGVGSSEDGSDIIDALQHLNIEARLFRPLSDLLNINKRNHRKLCVIDNEIAFVGSFNITDDHFGKNNDGKPWKDLAARVQDENVEKLLQSFEQIWRRIDRGNRFSRFRNFFSNHSRRMRAEKNARLVSLVHQARSRVWVTNAYFSPSHAFLKALVHAVTRGVSVQIIVPEKSDIPFFPALSSTYYADLLKGGVRIHEYKGNILHEKSMLVDHTAIVGSTNLNYRSFFHDLELDVLLNKPETIKILEHRFVDDLLRCEEITVPHLRRYSLFLRMAGWFSWLFRYWL